MKKIAFTVYSLAFAILYFASFTSFSTAIEEGNAGNFILMLPILGAITLVHYLTLVFINKKFMDVSFFAFEIIGGVVEKGAAAVIILIAVTLVLSPVAAAVVVLAHIAATVLSLTGKGGASKPKYSYKPTSGSSYSAPTPKAVPAKKPTPAPRAPQKSSYNFSDLSYEIKSAIGNGNSSLGYAGSYCLTSSMKNLNVNIYDGREITVNVTGTIRFKIDNNEVAYRAQCGDSIDSIRSALDRDTDRLIDETGKNIIARAKHAATMYEKANGYIPKSIEFNTEIGLEAVE